jgi:hypothetical protein
MAPPNTQKSVNIEGKHDDLMQRGFLDESCINIGVHSGGGPSPLVLGTGGHPPRLQLWGCIGVGSSASLVTGAAPPVTTTTTTSRRRPRSDEEQDAIDAQTRCLEVLRNQMDQPMRAGVRLACGALGF